MSYAHALLVARARHEGVAQRAATRLHRHLTDRPLALVFWQLGAEPFNPAAIAWGFDASGYELTAPGEPRNRDLTFAALLPLARAFNAWIEGGATRRGSPPQVILPNRGNLAMLGRVGRRIAYLRADGPQPADPQLARFGHHLLFLYERARHPGQQLVVVLTELLASHWACEMADLEAQSLPALDAMIEPPRGFSAYDAACDAERIEVGPVPTSDDDEALEPLLREFNESRKQRTEERIVKPRRVPIETHYRRLVDRAWPLMWRCLDRERKWPEAASAMRRWEDDIAALDRHLDWVVQRDGRYRTRPTHAMAARTLRDWEDAQRLLEAEEALDDPLKMLPTLLANRGVLGRVVDLDLEHEERPNKRSVRRPRVVLETLEPCLIAPGTELYWSKQPRSQPFLVEEVMELPRGGGHRIVLKHGTSACKEYPQVGESTVFSVHHTSKEGFLTLPKRAPWTHAANANDEQADDSDGDGEWT